MMISNRQAARRDHFSPRTLLSAGLLVLLATCLSLARADEFTVGHSGANVAYSQDGLDGSGVTVAVIDSGIQTKWDLQLATSYTSRILTQINFAPDNTLSDLCGHGTFVAGIATGNGKGSTGSSYYRTFYGVARNANIVSVRVLNSIGQGTVSNVISGIQWCITNKSRYNIKVINLSLGHPVGESYTVDPLCQAVEAAWKAGIVVVCAAGNNGRLNSTQTTRAANGGWGTAYGSIQVPGNDPYVITVGAMKENLATAPAGTYVGNRADDLIATYSSRGPSSMDYVMKPDIVAPGNQVISLTATNSYLDTTYAATNSLPWSAYMTYGSASPSHWYCLMSGTSMASPVVAGAAALMLQANPSLTPDTVKARLMISADKWTNPDGTTDPCTYGAGYIDIPSALACTAVPTMSALSPCLSEDSQGNVYVDPNMVIWGTTNGTQVIWGVSGVNNLQVIWGNQVLWGTSTNILSASQVLWGQSIWTNTSTSVQSSSAVDLSSTAIYGE